MPLTTDDTSALSPRERRRLRRALQFDSDPRLHAGDLGRLMSKALNPKRQAYKLKRKKKRKKHKRIYFGAFSRHRERDLDSGLFINKKHEPKLAPSSVIGKLTHITNGNIVAGLGGSIPLGADLAPSLHRQESWDQINPGPPFRGGGPLRLIEYHLPATAMVGFGRYTGQRPSGSASTSYGVYTGSFVDNGFWTGLSYDNIRSNNFSSFSNLSEFDSLAWDRLKPSLPKAGLAQFIYELKDLPGMIATSANALRKEWASVGGSELFIPVMRPRDAADHFLNHSFGWVPFLSDIVKLYNAWNNSVTLMSNIVRDNGIWVRRRRVLEESIDVGVETQGGVDSATIPSSGIRDALSVDMCKPFTLNGNTQKGFAFFRTVTERKVWAVGSFKYYRPEFDMSLFDDSAFSDWANIQRLITFYGLRVNPSLVYKLTPWTWLADWFTGFGSYLERLNDFVEDGIVSRGLYVMETLRKVQTKTSTLNFYSGPVTVNFQRNLLLKQRKLADSPYGFNAPWKDLSPRQWAILGAIGISRSKQGYISRGA